MMSTKLSIKLNYTNQAQSATADSVLTLVVVLCKEKWFSFTALWKKFLVKNRGGKSLSVGAFGKRSLIIVIAKKLQV